MKSELFLEEDKFSSIRKYLERLKMRDDAWAVQEIFIYTHIAGFFDLLEKRYLQKISSKIFVRLQIL